LLIYSSRIGIRGRKMSKPFIFTGLGLFLMTAWTFLSQVNLVALGGCVAGYTAIDWLMGR